MRDLHLPAFGLGRVYRLARKELREILRDRRTIVTLVAMPVLVYPLMSVVFLQFSLASKVTEGSPVYLAGVLTAAESLAFERRFYFGQSVLRRRGELQGKKRAEPQFIWRHGDAVTPPKTQEERQKQLEGLKDQLRERDPESRLNFIITIPNLDAADVDATGKPPAADHFLPCNIYVLPNDPIGLGALKEIEAAFAAADSANLKERLNLPAARPRILMLSPRPIVLEKGEAEGFVSLGVLVPLILILMTITGAVYPAIDLTAGERERGTLEILIAAPVPRFELLTAKYLSVLTVAILTALVNLVCMAITVRYSGMASALFGEAGMSVFLLLQVLALLFLFAGFFSAVLLCLTSFARSFKEAQAYLIPLMLASLGPGVMAMLPGLKLTGVLVVLPLVNIVLLARDLFEGSVAAGTATIVVLTTCLYALAALGLAARVFGAESVLYSEQSSWGDLLRRPAVPQPRLTISAALWCLALMVPIQFVLLALVRAVGMALSPTLLVLAGVAINLLLFGAVPGLFAYLGRLDLYQALQLAPPRPAALVAALVLGASLWPLELRLLAEGALSEALQERFGAVLQSFKAGFDALGYGVLAMVIVPAILEETYFRGLLWTALKNRAGALVTIGVSGLLFGATHVILGGVLGLERLAPSTLLGLILSVVCWRTGSLWPSLIMHVLHNSILLLVGLHEPGQISEVPWQWLAYGGAGTVFGAIVLWQWGGAPKKS